MNSNSFKHYGVPPIGKDVFISTMVNYVCFVLGNGSNNNADLLLSETIKSETQNATAIDFSKDYGEGLGQFDRGTFNDVINRISQKKVERIKMYFGVELSKLKYEDLRNSPLMSIVMIRLKYLLVPAPIPVDTRQRYEYYKKYYNSISGKATLSHWAESNGYVNV